MILYVCMGQNGWLNPGFYDPVVKCWIRVSRQAFPRQEGERGVRNIWIQHIPQFWICMPLIWNLGIAGTRRQFCIADFKNRYAPGKNYF